MKLTAARLMTILREMTGLSREEFATSVGIESTNTITKWKNFPHTQIRKINHEKIKTTVLICIKQKYNNTHVDFVNDLLKKIQATLAVNAASIQRLSEYYERYRNQENPAYVFFHALLQQSNISPEKKSTSHSIPSQGDQIPKSANDLQVQTTPEAKLQYYESLWQKYIHLEFRDDVQNQYLELFDGYIHVPPSRVNGNAQGFNGFAHASKNLILSPSGLGKTFLLRCLTLLQVYDYLKEQQNSVLSDRAISDSYCVYVKKLQQSYLPEGSCFPILITCGDIHSKGTYNNILQLAEGYTPELSDALCDLVNSAENILLIVDSVDEIVDDDTKSRFFGKLFDFIGEHQNSTVIISSRAINLPPKLDYFTKYQLPHFGIPEITFLAEKLLNGPEKAGMVVEMIKANPYLCKLAANPYMATTILAKDIQPNSGLYPVPCLHDVVNKIIQMRWNIIAGEVDAVKEILAHAAWHILAYQSTADSIDQEQLRKCVQEVLSGGNDERVERISKIILYSSGILTMQPEDRKQVYSFQNDILLHYFAADYIHRHIFERDDMQEENRMFKNVFVFFKDVIMKIKRNIYTEKVLQTLAMATVFENSYRFPWWKQRIPLLCLLDIGMSTKEEWESELVAEALAAIVNKTYNENDVTNSDGYGDLSRILSYLERLPIEIMDIDSVYKCYCDLKNKLENGFENSNGMSSARR